MAMRIADKLKKKRDKLAGRTVVKPTKKKSKKTS
jgi:hypothetical protein